MFVEAIIIWQASSDIGNILLSAMLNALGACKVYSNNICMLMDATVFNYFRHLGKNKIVQNLK